MDQTVCDDACVDTQVSLSHCGGCGIACGGGQVCSAGSCECPTGQNFCDPSCTDLASDVTNCGACGTQCSTGQLCNAGNCECPMGQDLCDDACVDTQHSNDHCGMCGNACVGGQSCDVGSCVCPEGQDLCGDTCIDTLADPQNCGGCGVECGLGESCATGMCLGGGPGEDGCEGLAEGLTLSRIVGYQTIAIPMMDAGQAAERSVDLIAGRQTLIRVFVEPDAGFSGRELSARLHFDNGGERATLFSGAQNVSGASEESDRDSTFEFLVDRELVTDQTRYAVEVVECTGPAGGTVVAPRYPTQDGEELRAISVGSLRIHVIPLEANGMVPDTSEQGLLPYVDGFLATYPVDSVEFTVGDTISVSNDQDWGGMLDGLRQLRENEGPDPEVYYYGMLKPTDSIRDYCGNGCTAGVGYVPIGFGGNLDESGRVALGLAFGDVSSVDTMLHEVGHNHGRLHAPCVPQGASIADVDPEYPHQNAELGRFGYDVRRDELIEPDRPDIMAYCNDPWFSDYTYGGLIDAVIEVNQVQQTRIVDPSLLGGFWVLLVDAAGGTRFGHPIQGPAMPAGQPEPAEILAENGSVLGVLDVYRTAVSDIDSFSIQIPEPQPGWAAVVISGVGIVEF